MSALFFVVIPSYALMMMMMMVLTCVATHPQILGFTIAFARYLHFQISCHLVFIFHLSPVLHLLNMNLLPILWVGLITLLFGRVIHRIETTKVPNKAAQRWAAILKMISHFANARYTAPPANHPRSLLLHASTWPTTHMDIIIVSMLWVWSIERCIIISSISTASERKEWCWWWIIRWWC